MRIGTAQMSRRIDKICIETLKIPSLVLMENAALRVVNNIDFEKFNSFVVVCGKGNNGGDGLAIARHLFILQKNVEIFLIGSEKGLSTDSKVNYDILVEMGVKINIVSNMNDLYKFRNYINASDVVIDCIFGTGLTRKVEGIYEHVISIINENSTYTISVDIPSGLNSDSGNVQGISVIAQKTVSFQLYKKGFLHYSSNKIAGKIIVENIGVPKKVIEEVCDRDFVIEKGMIKKSIKSRQKYSHKGNFGRVLIIAGSTGFSGAAYISTQTAVRSGAGLITLACPKEIQNILSCKLTEAMTINLEDEEKLNEMIQNSNVIALGPGMGNNNKTYDILNNVIEKAECPIVIDADAINVLQQNIHILKESKNKIIVTPHPGEMSRLTGISIKDINKNRLDVAKNFALENNVIVLLKGYNTIITDGKTTLINSTGTSAMANGGMGDCLTGMITALIAQGYDSLEAAYISAYVHGYCGDKLSTDMFCVNASHILEQIPFVLKEIKNS
ncbi:NAD(P)H-hydrate dehydratase [Haloimpatiens sp. FM7330]|uniref:NAD(P)H-hydrate dehydratase n=1 Tax=Haloimpatiens sp. FM7330 TaxID=3298610 RepID=UPI00363B5DC0